MNPSLISDGTSRHDMKQGDLNDCWFLSTLSAIAEKPQLISKVYGLVFVLLFVFLLLLVVVFL